MYCGRDNPDGATFCECGRPISLGGSSGSSGSPGMSGGYDSPFANQTLAGVKQKQSLPLMPIIVLILVLIGVGVFFGIRYLGDKKMTDESAWETFSKPLYSISLPSNFKKGEMLTVQSAKEKLLDFYTSRLGACDVCVYDYTEEEKGIYGGLTAQDFAKVFDKVNQSINGQEVKYKAREGQNYMYGEYSAHRPNYIDKSDEVWVIEALYPTATGYFIVGVYCAEDDKSDYRDYMFKWLDSFKPN